MGALRHPDTASRIVAIGRQSVPFFPVVDPGGAPPSSAVTTGPSDRATPAATKGQRLPVILNEPANDVFGRTEGGVAILLQAVLAVPHSVRQGATRGANTHASIDPTQRAEMVSLPGLRPFRRLALRAETANIRCSGDPDSA